MMRAKSYLPVSILAAFVLGFTPQSVLLARAASVEAHSQASLVEQWKGSLEYGVLLKQNHWQGWTDSAAGAAPEIEWMESYVNPDSEYSRLCRQTFDLAWASVEAAAKSRGGELAVVLDIDETVMLNIQFQKEIAGQPFDPAVWNGWIARMACEAVPGAKDFLDKVRGLGPRVHVAFMSDRAEDMNSYTIGNMRRLGLFADEDIVLSKTGKTDTKDVRRQCLTSGNTGTDARCRDFEPMVIIAKLGDALRDHFEIRDRAAAMGMLNDPRWGTEDFILPNPMYGQWTKDYK
ncbi:MAG: HAD family acid phosphatase [Elusimicrobiota bacterium]